MKIYALPLAAAMVCCSSCDTRSLFSQPSVDPSASLELDLSQGKPTIQHDADVDVATDVAGVGTIHANKHGADFSTDLAAQAEDALNDLIVPDVDWINLNVKLFDKQRHSISLDAHPERRDFALDATDFDRASWLKTPQVTASAYAEFAEPGRVRLQGSLDAGDARLGLIGVSAALPVPGTATSIQVRAAPFAPVSVYCPAAQVRFGTGVNYGTVIADAKGLAVIDMDVSASVKLSGDNALTISSPVNAGRINLSFNAD